MGEAEEGCESTTVGRRGSALAHATEEDDEESARVLACALEDDRWNTSGEVSCSRCKKTEMRRCKKLDDDNEETRKIAAHSFDC